MDKSLFLIKLIIKKYQNNDYIGVIKTFNDYVNLKEKQGIYGDLYNFYINSLIRLGHFEEAKSNIDKMIKLFPKQYILSDISTRYIACEMYQESEKILKDQKLSSNEYYIIGKSYFYKQQYDLSEHYLKLAQDEDSTLIDKIEYYLRRIEIYKVNNEVFKPTRYYTFKAKGHTLEPGYIIRADRLRDKYKCNLGNEDPYKQNRPFLIWKIVDNRIYAFPLSSRLRNDYHDGHILSKEKYQNYELDRRLQDKIICIKESDILYVDDKIDDDDFKKIIDKMYLICCYNHSIPRDNIKLFMMSMVKENRVHYKDIITVNHQDYKGYYFILEKDDNNKEYLTLEVEKDECGYFSLVSDELIAISMDSRIIDVLKLNCNQVGSLYDQINKTSYAKKRVIS